MLEAYIKNIRAIKEKVEEDKVWSMLHLCNTLSVYDIRAMIRLGYIYRKGYYRWGGNNIDNHMVERMHNLSKEIKNNTIKNRKK